MIERVGVIIINRFGETEGKEGTDGNAETHRHRKRGDRLITKRGKEVKMRGRYTAIYNIGAQLATVIEHLDIHSNVHNKGNRVIENIWK